MDQIGYKICRIIVPLAVDLLVGMAVTECLPLGTAEAAVVSALVALPVFFMMWIQDRKRNGVGGRKFGSIGINIGAFAAGMAASLILGNIMNVLGFQKLFSNQTQDEMLAANLLLQLIGFCMICPLTEELLFRGLVYGRMREMMPKTAAMAAAALLFAFAHGNVIQACYALPMALLLHWFYDRSGSLITPLLFHIGANLFTVGVHFGMR